MYCSSCGGRRAVVYQDHTGRRLCGACFLEDLRSRVHVEVKRWNMIGPGDVVAMGLSGGKDSFLLLEVLTQIHEPSKLLGVSIIEGIPGYNRREHVEALKRHASSLGVEVVVTSIRDYVGLALYDIVARSRARGARHSPCTYCGISRRRILNAVARELGATKTATAHNLDDEAQTAVINMLRGDVIGLLRQHPLAPPASSLVLPRIKPIRKIYEREAAAYAFVRKIPMQDTECMFISQAPTLRARVREKLLELESRLPGYLLKLMETLDMVLEKEASSLKVEELPRCSKCGEPTSHRRRVCKLCEILEEAGVKPLYLEPGFKPGQGEAGRERPG
jgi:uncharacterized protein (TIGR00269 family)